MATPFAREICRHFGLLFAAGTAKPPPAPAMSRNAPSAASQLQGEPSLQTAPSVVDNPAGPPAADGTVPGGPLASAPSVSAAASTPILPQGLRELDVHLFLDALVDLLCDKVRENEVHIDVEQGGKREEKQIWR